MKPTPHEEEQNMMTTKEQERKALEQIREILAGLGDDSYLATAFEGCIDDAEANIENDWALSMNGRWQDAEQKLAEAQTALSEISDKLIDEGERADRLQAELDETQADCDHWRDMARQYKKDMHETEIDLTVSVSEADGLREEIVHLKAKLYDLMYAGD